VGLRRGGLLETVVDGETGFLVNAADPAAYVPLVRRAADLSKERIRRHAGRFSHTRFADHMTRWVDDATR
jgi:glycosyltransferase involved in cell wall biosynthesis